jgi:signal transduction histidine kinase
MASNRKIRIDLQAAEGADTVTLDLRKFKQVLYNLLSNALKFSHDEAVVKLIIEQEADQQFKIAVKDYGIGIKSEDMPRIFREFEQLKSGSARRFPGTGLGLVLTKRIIELHGGSIRVQSEFGKGSTFTVTMPRSATTSGKPPPNTSDLLAAREL